MYGSLVRLIVIRTDIQRNSITTVRLMPVSTRLTHLEWGANHLCSSQRQLQLMILTFYLQNACIDTSLQIVCREACNKVRELDLIGHARRNHAETRADAVSRAS